jgi:serine/threonine-protein kinase
MERIGEYVVRRLVGEGGMGKVYEAEERLSKRRVALKVLRPELTRSEEGRRLFLNEMQILAQLEHPNVVRSLATCEVDGQLVMALEFLEGRTLRDELVARGRLPWPEAVRVILSVAEGLAAAHSQEPAVVHRDLKPENVMLAEGAAGGGAAQVKVMDFGVAKVLAAAKATNTQSVGTLQYMSPEQIDARTIDARSDLYALGLLFYECLAGEAPFRSASPRELLNLQCTAPAPELPQDVRATLPAGVEEVVFRLLEKSPDARPANAREVLQKLAPFVAAAARSGAAAGSRSSSVSTASTVPALAAPASPRPPASPPPDASARRSGDTLLSTPHPAPPRRADTIDLVERAAQPRQISNALAIAIILLLSLVAGLTAYVLRLRIAPSPQAVGGEAGQTLSATRR